MINIDEDIKQRIKVTFIFLLQVYKITTGTMLTLFIPQSCGDKICSLKENYDNRELYHKSVLYWNMFSMFTFYLYYIIELRREEWAIKYLDIDNNKPDNGLKEIIKNEPILDKKMDRLNIIYYRSLFINCVVYFINLCLSIKVLVDNYHSTSTLSCFASFSLLVLMKLYNSYDVAYQSVKNDKMMSAYMNEFVSFNILDKDYVANKIKNKEKENIIEIIKEIEQEKKDKVDPEEIITVMP